MKNRVITVVWFRAFDKEYTEVFAQTNPEGVEFYKNSVKVKTTNDAIFHDIYQFQGKDGTQLLTKNG